MGVGGDQQDMVDGQLPAQSLSQTGQRQVVHVTGDQGQGCFLIAQDESFGVEGLVHALGGPLAFITGQRVTDGWCDLGGGKAHPKLMAGTDKAEGQGLGDEDGYDPALQKVHSPRRPHSRNPSDTLLAPTVWKEKQ